MYNKIGGSDTNSESWNFTDNIRVINSVKNPGSSNFDFSDDNLGGKIFILFHI